MPDIVHPEPTEAPRDLTQYLSLVLYNAFEELEEGKFRNENGAVPYHSETVMGVLSSIGKDGLDSFKLENSEFTPNGIKVTLRKTFDDGTEVKVSYNGPEVSIFESSTIVVRNVAVGIKKSDQHEETTVELHNLESADAKMRINSTLIIDNGIDREKYNNPEDVAFGEAQKDGVEIIEGFRYRIIKGARLLDTEGKLVLDISRLMEESQNSGILAIGAPDISKKDLDPLKNAISEYASLNHIPVTGIVYDSIGPRNDAVEGSRMWAGGVPDGSHPGVTIRIYPKEFFESKDAISQQVFQHELGLLKIGR